jgi:hypothetical protein
MTAVWILVGIAGFLALLLSISICISVSIDGEVRVSAGILGYRYPIVPAREKSPKKETKKTKQVKQAKRKAEQLTEKKKADERSFGETVDLVLALAQAIVPGAVRLLSHLRFTGMQIDIAVAADSADQTAIRYGGISAGVYNLLAALDTLFTLKVKSVDIVPDFVGDESRYQISFRAKLRLFWIVAAALGMLFRVLKAVWELENPAEEKKA